eukprot:XP_001707149.1 Hypothetical protein GL50803_32637 [Giardia lamblia ATCC 50803]
MDAIEVLRVLFQKWKKLIAVGLAQNNKGARNYRLVDGRTTGRYPRTREINKQGVQATGTPRLRQNGWNTGKFS